MRAMPLTDEIRTACAAGASGYAVQIAVRHA